MAITLCKAVLSDVPRIEALIARSARGLSTNDYRPSQVEAAIRAAFGVDTQLLADQTYFVAEEDGQLVGCGGWSFRATLFGSDARANRDSSHLDPLTQAAKISSAGSFTSCTDATRTRSPSARTATMLFFVSFGVIGLGFTFTTCVK